MFVRVSFFSSRRRHTISYGDWSSDVCSSDLGWDRISRGEVRARGNAVPAVQVDAEKDRFGEEREPLERERRSEERRVGKECRSRGTKREGLYNTARSSGDYAVALNR